MIIDYNVYSLNIKNVKSVNFEEGRKFRINTIIGRKITFITNKSRFTDNNILYIIDK